MKKVVVSAAVLKNENRILICQRGHNKLHYLSEKWEFPGGKIENGESPEEALVREIKEELDIDIINPQFAITVVHNYEHFQLKMHTFICTINSRIFLLNDHINAEWINLETIDQFNWAAADLPIVEFLKDPNV